MESTPRLSAGREVGTTLAGMARFEVGLITPLRFKEPGDEDDRPIEDLWKTATASISFEGLEFVWHDPDEEHDPALTVVHEDTRPVFRAVQEATQRLLSALAFETGLPIGTLGPGSGSGETDARWQAGVHPPRSSYGVRLRVAPSSVSVLADKRVRLALALHREALSANSPLYRFLAYWNAIEAAIPNRTARRAFVDALVPPEWHRRKSDEVPKHPYDYFWKRPRTAVAHGEHGPGRVVNPDEPAERARLESDADVLEPLVRNAILRDASGAVRVEYPQGAK